MEEGEGTEAGERGSDFSSRLHMNFFSRSSVGQESQFCKVDLCTWKLSEKAPLRSLLLSFHSLLLFSSFFYAALFFLAK